jgi:gamma-glutamyltranspeptidase/glutathione hydrolase
MIRLFLALATLVPQQSDTMVLVQSGVRDPAFSPSGRVIYELDGDLWVSNSDLALTSQTARSAPSLTRPSQVTSGPAWDRHPAWAPDGETIVFSSDRNGSFDLWNVTISEAGAVGQPTVQTRSTEPESEPTVGPDGTIVFVRGMGQTTDLWAQSPEGELRQLTTLPGAELSPAFSPDGQSIAYVSVVGRQRQLRTKRFRGSADTLVVGDMAVEHPTWSPDGNILSFTTRSTNRGVWITPVDGSYVNLVSAKAAVQSWSPDGSWLILATLSGSDLGYNGDPNRLGNAQDREELISDGRLWVTRAPSLPETGLVEVPVVAEMSRTARNTESFDRLWDRMDQLYYSETGGSEWERLRAEYRPRAVGAPSDSVLEELKYEMLRQRPHLRPEASGSAAVSSAHSLASAAGVEMLSRGGNVIDAAVAVSFAIGVVEPDASGIGGYGEMVLHLNGMEEPVVIEFLTRVPEQAGLDNGALLVNGNLPVDGPVLANVPGTVAGMWKAWEKYGSGNLEWSDLLRPAIQLAANGFVLDEAFTTTLAREQHRFEKYESSRKIFFPNGSPLVPGDTLRNPDLAWTLGAIADGGADAFYRGEVAQRLVADLRGKGNAMTVHDMARYFAVERDPIQGVYHGHTVYSAAPAAGGGVSLVTKLNLLDNEPPSGLHSDDPSALHAMIEAWKLAPSTNGRLADPSLWPVDLEPVLDKESAVNRWQRCFDPDRGTGPDELRRVRGGPVCADLEQIGFSWGEELLPCIDANDRGCRAHGTTAFTVADADGNIVAVTQTLGTWGGNFYVTPGLGFLYNDKLRSYRTEPSSYGARLPYARHGTSIAPTLVFKGEGTEQRPLFAVAAAGNSWITPAVYQMVVGMIDQGLGPQDALEIPRFLVGVRRNGAEVSEIVIQIEDGFAPEVMRSLERMGHDTQLISLRGELRMGYGAAVLIDGGIVRAGGDPRRSGGAGAIP